jgi:glutathione peroxidase
VVDIDGKTMQFKKLLQGKKVVLIVNTATEWGLSEKDFASLVSSHKKFRNGGFEIVAFPCNQFKEQEPGTNREIKEIMTECYEARFPLMAKSDVNGPNANNVYKYLRMNASLFAPNKW